MIAGLHRTPIATITLFAVTATVSVVGLAVPTVTAALERYPTVLHGEPWRLLTSLLVQDGGVAGTASNLLFLAVLGAAVEQVVSRPRMLLCYLLAGVAGQITGLLWQPFGAGNSVAVCGLAGVLAWSVTDRAAPPWSTSATALWLGALLATWSLPLVLLGVAGTVTDRVAGGVRRRPGPVRTGLLVASVLVGVVLVCVRNVHGTALLVGLVAGRVFSGCHTTAVSPQMSSR